MNGKGLAVLALFALASLSATGQQSDRSTPEASQPAPHATTPLAPRPVGASQTAAPSRSYTAHPAAPAAGPAAANGPATPSDCEAGPCDYRPAQISIATPAPAPASWPWQERIAWVANIVLVILGYAAIFVALSLLRKIDRQTQYAETAAQAAADAAQAVLQQAQATARAERPWVLVTVEPSRRVENGFMVVATNRGRSPARIVSAVDRITIEADQTKLPEVPDYSDAQANAALASVILLPGESTGIKPFSRNEVRQIAGTDERLKRIEKWEEVILLYGKIVYQDLVAEGEAAMRETNWCCWYIHGRQNSGMVMAGSPAYSRHT